ncbi:SMP-30/gluconolactonase/LRE family protein [Algoriphagus namhaensis]|uniref:SMP-30/gluconolactonase/LRE family protein n=1 Tax=Algoriphagus namhaensis TaxID=915353 RepID=A0ABV8AU95_9BACT
MNYQTTGSIERLDPRINDLIAEDAQIEILASGFDWSEGPLWLEDQQALIFSDVPANKIYRWSEKDSLSVFLEPSGYFGERTDKKEPGSNGLTLDRDGNLLLCQHGLRQVGRIMKPLTNPKPEYENLASEWEGKKFNSPNDLVVHSNGGIYFTDPPYGLDDWDVKELDFQGVYRLMEEELTLQIDSLYRPNGVALSPDEKILYVAQSDFEAARYYAYDLDENGEVIAGKILLDVTYLLAEGKKGLPDGLKVHSSGTIFATGPGGVLVISKEGEILGTIRTGESTANCAFDNDENYLYMTADMHLMRIALK